MENEALRIVSIFLENDDNIKTLEKLIAAGGEGLPGKARQNLENVRRCFRRKSSAKKGSYCSSADRNLAVFTSMNKDSVCVPSQFVSQYEKWQTDWPSLFSVSGSRLHGRGDITEVLREQYRFTSLIQQQTWSSNICTRFLMICYYNMSRYDEGCESTASILATDDGLQSMLSIINKWISLGERWNSLCRDLGGYGILFVLPEGIGETVWARIPLTGPKREHIITKFRQLGIESKVKSLDANKLGLEICQGLLHRNMPRARLPAWVSSQRARELATLLHLLGPSKVPLELFARARNQYLVWGPDGQAVPKKADIVEVVQNADTFREALRHLESKNAILTEDITGNGHLTVNSDILQELTYCIDEWWKREAIKIVFSAFPTDRRLLPWRSFSTETSMLPQLRHVLQLLTEINVSDALPPAHIAQVCLSASNYRTFADKANLVAMAESLAERYTLSDLVIKRIALRRLVLSRISSSEWSLEDRRLEFPRSDQRSNGYYGEYLLYYSESLFRSRGPDAALLELDTYEPWIPGQPSTLETARLYEVGVLRGKILHFSGRFREAKETLEKVISSKHQDTTSASKATAHLAAVCCELGEADLGIRYASAHLRDVLEIQSAESGSARRLKLALAYAFLLKIMWSVLAGTVCNFRPTPSPQDLERAQQLFRDLDEPRSTSQTWPTRVHRVSVLLGLAVIAHIGHSWQDALLLYDVAFQCARECGWKAGYIESVIYLSRSVVLHELGETVQADDCATMAKMLYSSHLDFFVGFGTLWPEILKTWFNAQRREAVIPGRTWERNWEWRT
ncbi:hypothetical protein CKM354_000632300 [Cercospora kikuchii]|uniref:Uncharacterized protein n=1 Tax=Cercospora kikuchii TaxID=84275 RepID=A0A9P3FGE0_9PEZI|nr:uncharacterized protein CKM354_000632300 [Cercospora kikuchii]GIZ43082.1 hypothetical protein CKM354_000632300 [Cercospora kikuchii]